MLCATNIPFGPYMWNNCKISESKTKPLSEPVQYKIAAEDKILEQILHFVFLGCDTSYAHRDNKNKNR